MPNEKKESKKRLLEGYQPTEGDLDSSNPPKGGSGVPSKTENKSDNKK